MTNPTLHCQCCGRAILANTGKIAHHGYRRPVGWHSQTASCMGAKHLPFEADRAVLGRMINLIEQHVERTFDALAATKNETAPVPFRYTTRDGYAGRSIERSVDVTRETFEMVREAYENQMRKYGVYDFDTIKNKAVRSLELELRHTEDDRKAQQARFDGWTQTHRWDAGAWIAI